MRPEGSGRRGGAKARSTRVGGRIFQKTRAGPPFTVGPPEPSREIAMHHPLLRAATNLALALLASGCLTGVDVGHDGTGGGAAGASTGGTSTGSGGGVPGAKGCKHP